MNRRESRAGRMGFTLMEVLFALAIVSTALFVLVSAHQTALNLYVEMEEQVVLRSLKERAVGLAEIGVLSGELSGGGDFGSRMPGYSWTYEATLINEESPVLLYHVNVSIFGEEAEDLVEYLLFNPDNEQVATG